MKKLPTLPDIPESEQTPVVKSLLLIVEQCFQSIQQQAEEVERLKDEVRVLKKQKKRPTFKPSNLDRETDKSTGDDSVSTENKKRAGSKKRSKNANLTIHDDQVVQPQDGIPPGARFKGYRDFIVQELVIGTKNTRYRLARYVTPDGQTLTAKLPKELNGLHYGPYLLSYVLYQHHHCHVTQPLLLEQLREWGIDISAGQINRLLSEGKSQFHQEKNDILKAGLALSDYVTVDDSGARHKGVNGYVTQIGNEYFAWFESTGSNPHVAPTSHLTIVTPFIAVPCKFFLSRWVDLKFQKLLVELSTPNWLFFEQLVVGSQTLPSNLNARVVNSEFYQDAGLSRFEESAGIKNVSDAF